ncbi:MAG: ABC transporter permease [Desulfobacteraceae bacterium]|nr:MAG: ABC transporter permease [Desulfobacteraceae bacterium]
MREDTLPAKASEQERILNVEAAFKTVFRRVPPLIMISMAWLLLVFFVAIFHKQLMPMDYRTTHLVNRLAPPVFLGGDSGHLLGTDTLGRDTLSRLIRSIYTSLTVAFLGAIITAVLGTVIGFIAAHFKGIVDEILMTLVDFQYAMPFMILALLVLAFFGNNIVLFVILLGIQGWMRFARLARGMALSAQEDGYAVAVKQLGATPFRIYLRHIFPNVSNIIVVEFTLNFPEKIIVETSLSFIGLGIQPPETSLGSMISFGRDYLMAEWWLAVIPGAVIFLTTLAMSLVGDWTRDNLDPTVVK